MTKADKKHRAQVQHLWTEVYLMHYNAKRKGIARMASVHADNAVKVFEQRFGKTPPGEGRL